MTLDAVDATLKGRYQTCRVHVWRPRGVRQNRNLERAVPGTVFDATQGVDVLIKITFRSSLHRPPGSWRNRWSFSSARKGRERNDERVDLNQLLKKILRAKRRAERRKRKKEVKKDAEGEVDSTRKSEGSRIQTTRIRATCFGI